MARPDKLPVRSMRSLAWLPCLFGMLASAATLAEGYPLQSLSVRARLSEKTVLGKDAPESFKAYDVSANFTLPWKHSVTANWGAATRLMSSAGLLQGEHENALVLSLIPELTFGSHDGRFTLDLGAGGALFSRHRFGTQDFGGPFQFALTLGIGVPIYKRLGVAYRFLHYSDAGLNGSSTTGADFHMIEFSYRY